MLSETDDDRRAPGLELIERHELAVLRLLCARVDGPAVRAAIGVPETLRDSLHHVVAERVAEHVRVNMRLGGRVPHEIGQEALDQPVLADDALSPLDPGGSEDRLFLLAALDEPVYLEALQHLPG